MVPEKSEPHGAKICNPNAGGRSGPGFIRATGIKEYWAHNKSSFICRALKRSTCVYVRGSELDRGGFWPGFNKGAENRHLYVCLVWFKTPLLCLFELWSWRVMFKGEFWFDSLSIVFQVLIFYFIIYLHMPGKSQQCISTHVSLIAFSAASDVSQASGEHVAKNGTFCGPSVWGPHEDRDFF